MKLLFLFFILLTSYAHAKDPLLATIDVASSAMRAQSERLKVIAQNIANADSTGETPGADPYRRRTIIFKRKFNRAKGVETIYVKYDQDTQTNFKKKYDPSHPAADNKGYVAFPNVETVIENADSKEAVRSYEANLNSIEIARSMTSRTLDLLK